MPQSSTRAGLRWCDAFSLHCDLELASGRKVHLDDFNQSRTYQGLGGTPDNRTSEWTIRNAMKRAQELCVPGGTPHLLAPERRSFFREPGDCKAAIARGRLPEFLPAVQCLCSFSSYPPIEGNNSDAHGSSLVVVLFQDSWALPFSDDAMSRLLKLDWEELATNFIH